MKKLIVAGLIVCLCLLGACGAPQSDAPDATPTADEYGLDFTEEEIQSAVAVAKQYYAQLASEELDASLLSADEISELEERNQWLEQGVQVEYRVYACQRTRKSFLLCKGKWQKFVIFAGVVLRGCLRVS